MFKTDKKSLDELAFAFSEEDIAKFRRLLELTKSQNISTLSKKEHDALVNGLNKIGKLKLNSKYYAFHVSDSYVERQTEGVEVYLRRGNLLRDYFVPGTREFVYEQDEICEMLKDKGIKRVYTGPLFREEEFLGLPGECDEEHPIIREKLHPDEVEFIREKGIEVIVLEELI